MVRYPVGTTDVLLITLAYEHMSLHVPVLYDSRMKFVSIVCYQIT
jgi:hypothetical protein